MAFPIFQVDAFTDKPFSGNPAAVCLLLEPGEVEWIQADTPSETAAPPELLEAHGISALYVGEGRSTIISWSAL